MSNVYKGQKIPEKLGALGRELWADTRNAYELAPHEEAVLLQACRTLDLIETMRRRVQLDGIVSVGSMGQQVANPLLSELRQSRALFSSLMRSLALPDVEVPGAVDITPNQNRSAAQSRWGKAHG